MCDNVQSAVRGIGVDIVAVWRFAAWHQYQDRMLLRIFTSEEIAYCRSGHVPAQRFAARFAAKEAFYKALCAAGIANVTLMHIMRACSVEHGTTGAPRLRIRWDMLSDKTQKNMQGIDVMLSLSHCDEYAAAFVVLSGKNSFSCKSSL